MDNKENGLQLLNSTILKKTRHQDYKRVTDLSKEYYDIFTGTGISKFLKQILRREDKEMFEQRCTLTQTTIPATVDNLDAMFNKPLRSNRIYSSIEHKSSIARDEIVQRLQMFYQGESESGVDAYLQSRWKSLNIYDPNAFIAIEFGDFDPTKDKTYPFPIEYSSTEIVNYEYKNGLLEWIIAQISITYRTDTNNPDKKSEGSRYIIYLDNSAIELIQVDNEKRITDIQNPVFFEVKDKNGKLNSVYVINYYETKSNGVPLFRVGYKPDPQTNGRTVVSCIDAALNFFKKEIKTASEFDLTMSLHVFPQKIQYGVACTGDKEKAILCNNGRTPNGEPCPVCKGSSMVPIATSAQDIIFVKPPRTKDDPVLDLEKAVVYKSPPIDVVKFQEEYLDKLTQRAKAAVFAESSVQRKTLEQTATELDYSWDNVYDTFYDFGKKYSFAWKFIVQKIAVYTDNFSSDFKVYHQFPKDLKLKGIEQLLNEAALASKSGLSQHAINAINADVLDVLYSDDADTLLKIRTKDKFHPFSGKSETEIQSLLMAGDLLPYYKTLYTYFDIIFDEIDNEMGDNFYLMTFQNQQKEVKKKVEELILQVSQQSAARLVIPPISGQ